MQCSDLYFIFVVIVFVLGPQIITFIKHFKRTFYEFYSESNNKEPIGRRKQEEKNPHKILAGHAGQYAFKPLWPRQLCIKQWNKRPCLGTTMLHRSVQGDNKVARKRLKSAGEKAGTPLHAPQHFMTEAGCAPCSMLHASRLWPASLWQPFIKWITCCKIWQGAS